MIGVFYINSFIRFTIECIPISKTSHGRNNIQTVRMRISASIKFHMDINVKNDFMSSMLLMNNIKDKISIMNC